MKRFAVLGFLALSSGLQAAPPSQVTSQLLTDGWSRKISARKTVDGLMQMPGASQRQAQEAYLLVLIHQRRYRQARPVAERLAASDSPKATAGAAQVWLSAVMRQYTTALGSMESLSGEVTKASLVRQIELAGFLGRMMGFLDGPASKRIPTGRRDAARQNIENRLGALAGEFQKARADILKQYLDQSNVLAATLAKGIQQEKKLRGQLKLDVKDIRRRNDQQQASLDERRTKVDRQYRVQSSDIRKQESPIRRELRRVDDAASSVQYDRATLNRRIWRVRSRLERSRHRQVRSLYRREIRELEHDLGRSDFDLAILSQRAYRAEYQRRRLANQAFRLRQQYGSEHRSAQKQQKKLDRRHKRTDYEERRLKRPIRGHSTRSNEIKRRIRTLATYVTLPLERQRADILATK